MGRDTFVREVLHVVPKSAREAGALVGLAVAYVALGLFSQQLNNVGHGLAVMWFPSGLAAFLVRRPGRWPAIFVASIVTDAAVGTPLLSLVSIGIGNSLEAIAAAWLLRAVARPDLTATGLDGFRQLVLASWLAPIASVVFGLGGLLLTGTIVDLESLPSAATTWWLSDMLGILLVAPAILALLAGRYVARRDSPVTLAVLVVGVSAIGGLVYSDVLAGSPLAMSRAFLGVPVLAFMAIRYGTAAVSAVLALGGAFVAALLAAGQGPFLDPDPLVASTSLGTYFLIIAMTGHGLAAVFREREVAAVTARRAEAETLRLATAIEQAADAVIVTDNAGVIEYVNPAFERAFGYADDEVVDHAAAEVIRSGAHSPEFYAEMDATIARGDIWAGAIVDRRRDGSTFEFDATISPIRDPHGMPAGAVTVGRDRSHERQLEADLKLEADVHIALGQALQALPRGAAADQAAQALCDALWQVPGVSFVAVLGFSGTERMTALGIRSAFALPDVASSVSARSRDLRKRAVAGPWAEPWQATPADRPWARALTSGGVKAIAYGPIVHGDHVDGLLTLGSSDDAFARGLINRLPAVVDFTSTPTAILADRLHAWRERTEVRDALERTIRRAAFSIVFQPVVDFATGEAVGFEALTRFASKMEPSLAFREAWRVGLGLDLELSTLAAAIEAARELPAGAWLALNMSPRLFEASDRLRATLAATDRPLVVEITEHQPVEDYVALSASLDRLRELGVRVAVDDVGSGFASFRHVTRVNPDILKLDRTLVCG
ncbi:MAG TPA: EAL domain-containing protein, partial [Candidatus Acidoferrales bacterium]|nr:EAL domain-containing protein [Candidatus Acidoferrales bacterium]